MSSAPNPPETHPPITLPALFLVFLKMSLAGFGGPVVWARRILVERRRWLTDAEFADLLSLCQVLPGPMSVTIAVGVGASVRGAAGALAGVAGFIRARWPTGFVLGALLLASADLGRLQGILRGVSAAASGLLIATGARLFLPHRGRPAA